LTWIKAHRPDFPPNDGALHLTRDFYIEVACLPERNLVFVVDDDPAMLQSVARLLRQFGYASLLFPSAEAFANHNDFDRALCVVLDINLGDVSGIALRHRLKEANISVPVIYITGNDSPAVREAAHQSGCLAYLTKPFPAKSLMEPLHKAATGLA
jgi:FixJ family two-component response regulator